MLALCPELTDSSDWQDIPLPVRATRQWPEAIRQEWRLAFRSRKAPTCLRVRCRETPYDRAPTPQRNDALKPTSPRLGTPHLPTQNRTIEEFSPTEHFQVWPCGAGPDNALPSRCHPHSGRTPPAPLKPRAARVRAKAPAANPLRRDHACPVRRETALSG